MSGFGTDPFAPTPFCFPDLKRAPFSYGTDGSRFHNLSGKGPPRVEGHPPSGGGGSSHQLAVSQPVTFSPVDGGRRDPASSIFTANIRLGGRWLSSPGGGGCLRGRQEIPFPQGSSGLGTHAPKGSPKPFSTFTRGSTPDILPCLNFLERWRWVSRMSICAAAV